MATSIGYATLQIVPSAQGFSSALSSQTSGSMAAAGSTSSKKFGSSFLAGAKSFAGPLALAFGGAAAFGFVKGSISAASSLEESVNAVNVSYGKAADGILKLGQSSATAFGLSKLELNEAAVRLSGFTSQIGGTASGTTKAFESILGRATDFASVMNLDVNEALGLFQSGLAGETEPLRRYGIDLSAASVAAYAYAEGIAKKGEELTEAQKVQARYGALLEQTAKTEGDFANTSGGLANQQRILSANFADLKAKIGAFFLPIMTKVVSALNGAIGPVMRFVKSLSGGGGLSDVLGGKTGQAISSFVETVKTGFADLWTSVGPLLQELGRVFQEDLIPAIRRVIPAIQPVVSWLTGVGLESLKGMLSGVIEVARGLIQWLSGVLDFVAGVFSGDWSRAWKGFTKAVSGAGRVILGIVKTVFSGLLLTLWRKAIGALRALWGKAWGAIKALAGKVWDGLVAGVKSFLAKSLAIVRSGLQAVRDFFSNVWTAIRDFVARAFSTIVEKIRSAIDRIREVVSSGLGKVKEFFLELPGKILDAVSGFGTLLYDAGRAVVQGLVDGIKSLASAPIDAVKDIGGGIIDAGKGVLGINSPSKVFHEIGLGTMEGFENGIAAGGGNARAAMSRAIAPPSSPKLAGGGLTQSIAAGSGGPSVAKLYLDGREVAEAVFDVGGRELSYGRRAV